MVKPSQINLELSLATDGGAQYVAVAVANHSGQPVTVVALDRYLTIELRNSRGQFIQGAKSNVLSIPRGENYVTIPKDSVQQEVFRLEISANAIGSTEFPEMPKTTMVRVLYRADQVMPNLPSSCRRSFFSGPTKPKSIAIELP